MSAVRNDSVNRASINREDGRTGGREDGRTGEREVEVPVYAVMKFNGSIPYSAGLSGATTVGVGGP